MRLALISDTHIGARQDSLIFSEYFLKFYENVFLPYLDANNITNVAHLGDVVDRRKFINYVILNQFRTRLVDRLRAKNIFVDVLVGNHDVPYRNSNEVNAVTELFGSYPNVNLIHEPVIRQYESLSVAMIPWINSGNYSSTMKFIQECKADVAMAHLELAGFEMDKGNVNRDGMDRELFSRFETVYSGHYHHKSDDGHVYYLGNPYQMTWADVDDVRGFHVLDTETRELEFIPNPYTIFEKVYYDDTNDINFPKLEEIDFAAMSGKYIKTIVVNKTNPFLFDTYINRILQANPQDLTIVEDFTLESNISDEEIESSENTLSLLKKYIDGMEDDVSINKEILYNKMHQLYVEASSMEI